MDVKLAGQSNSDFYKIGSNEVLLNPVVNCVFVKWFINM